MRVFGYYDFPKIDKAYLRQSRSVEQKKSVSNDSKLRKTDELVLSPRAAELQKFEELVKKLPELQDEKANSIRKQIESGEYSMDSKSVAKSIIDLLG
jgi:flagellar biosynthesis anti-sigma factor FlgM